MVMVKRRMPPWHYPRDWLPSWWTLADWRKRARDLAQSIGAKTSCDLCKRPTNAWGMVALCHPLINGHNWTRRRTCPNCATLMVHMLQVLEWLGACDNLPPMTVPEELLPEHLQQRLEQQLARAKGRGTRRRESAGHGAGDREGGEAG